MSAHERSRKSGYEHLAPLFGELAKLAPGSPEHERVRGELVGGHLPVAKHIAHRFAHRGEPEEDLEQVAVLGLILAVDRFDPERGSDFLSFAVPTITGEVRRHFRDTAWAVRVPRRLKERHLAIRNAVERLTQRHGRPPRPSLIAEDLGISTEEVLDGLEAATAYRSDSLDRAPGPDSETTLADQLGEDDLSLELIDNREAVRPLLEQLPARERTILMLRFFGELTQAQIAERMGISQMHVSRLLAKTLTGLRAAAKDRHLAEGPKGTDGTGGTQCPGPTTGQRHRGTA